MVAGLLQQLPVMYVMVGGAASAALLSNFLRNRAESRRDHSPEYKLAFNGVEFNAETNPDESDSYIKSFQPIILLKNNAYFPIQYNILVDYFELDGDLGEAYNRDASSPVVMPGDVATRTFSKHRLQEPIKVGPEFRKIEGKLHLKYQYGYPGKMKFTSDIYMKIRARTRLTASDRFQFQIEYLASDPFDHR